MHLAYITCNKLTTHHQTLNHKVCFYQLNDSCCSHHLMQMHSVIVYTLLKTALWHLTDKIRYD